ncbi:MAG: hypothetical protein MRK00_12300 [Nitrosomonas sp.]|nr:hypothetical protein [Nitrosomonas sp.]
MAKLDELKELIGFLKVLFASFVALDASLIAWLFKNSDDIQPVVAVGSLFLIGLFSVCIILCTKAILSNIKQMENL